MKIVNDNLIVVRQILINTHAVTLYSSYKVSNYQFVFFQNDPTKKVDLSKTERSTSLFWLINYFVR